MSSWAERARVSAVTILVAGSLVLSTAQGQSNNHDFGQLPSWIVLALRIESDEAIYPSTGIVVSDNGTVLVPSEFTAGKGQLVVLDGGNDIARYGRPAKLVQSSNVDGLAVIQVENLRRRPVRLSAQTPVRGDPVTLLAYPPAKDLGAGHPPLIEQRTIDISTATGKPTFSNATLPNVAGAIVNTCGDVVALSIANGLPSGLTHSMATYVWGDSLRLRLESLKVRLNEAPCAGAAEPPVQAPSATQPAPVVIATAQPSSPAQPAIATQTVAMPAQTATNAPPRNAPPAKPKVTVSPPTTSAPKEQPKSTSRPEEIAPSGTAAPDPAVVTPQAVSVSASKAQPPVESPAPMKQTGQFALLSAFSWWTALIAGGVLLVVALLVWILMRRKSSADVSAEDVGADVPAIPAATLVLETQLSDGRCIRKPIPALRGIYDAVIGRSNSDIDIPLDTISRRHARIVGTKGALRLLDLGSSNGTAVNEVPLVRNEPIALQIGDRISLGGTLFTLVESGS